MIETQVNVRSPEDIRMDLAHASLSRAAAQMAEGFDDEVDLWSDEMDRLAVELAGALRGAGRVL